MKTFFMYVLVAVFICFPANAAPMPQTFADLAEAVTPAVVNISTVQKLPEQNQFSPPGMMMPFPPGSPFEDMFRDFFGSPFGGMGPMPFPQQNVPSQSLGSGFIIDKDKGLVVTNYHVIENAEEIQVTLNNDNILDAEIVGADEKTDIALLRVQVESLTHDVDWGDSEALRVGDWVLAVGNPFGLGGTVTAGIVSARQRNINSGPYDNYIQTDASINRGNSGGPMFDMDGRVVGINTAIYSPSGGSVGIGFAVPAALAKDVIEQLATYGETKRAWLGVKIQEITPEIAESMDLETTDGALIAGITPDGPADKAGLQVGDILLEFNETTVETMRQLPLAVAGSPIGEGVSVKIWRNGKTKQVQVKLERLEDAESAGKLEAVEPKASAPSKENPDGRVEISELGISVSPITRQWQGRLRLESRQGIVVTDVDSKSDAAKQGIRPGLVILSANQSSIDTPQDLASAVKQAKTDDRGAILLEVMNRGDTRFIGVKLRLAD